MGCTDQLHNLQTKKLAETGLNDSSYQCENLEHFPQQLKEDSNLMQSLILNTKTHSHDSVETIYLS